MREFLYDVVLSFCPASFRRSHLPHSSRRVLLTAILSGALQALLCAYGVFSGYKALLILRASQYGQILERSTQTTQAWFAIVLFVEYILFHPWGLFPLYMAIEGCVRFFAAVCVSEVVPSLPVVLSFKLIAYVRGRKARRELEPLAAIPDSLQTLADGKRLLIAASLPKPHWNGDVNILIRDEWYEVEAQEQGAPPRPYIYLLRPVPIGKIMRIREEYDEGAAISTNAAAAK